MRVFIAARFTDEIKKTLTETMAELRRQGVRGAYTRPENLHMTLAFIGETEQIREIHAAVETGKAYRNTDSIKLFDEE